MSPARYLLLPWWIAQLPTGAKAFCDNPVIGSPTLNRWGLHVGRIRLAAALAAGRRARLAALVGAEDRAAFDRDGFVLRRDFLSTDAFAALRTQALGYAGRAREMVQGDTVTRRIALDPEALATMPAVRALLRDPAWRGLTRYVGSFDSEPISYIQTILSHVRDAPPDPQTALHADTFHPTVKAWLFLTDVAAEEGPFVYVAGSHRMTPARLDWERERSLHGRDGGLDRLSARGSLRVREHELAALGLPAPRVFAVPANTLVVADTSGFHARGPSLRASTRIEIWAYGRRNPFLPWTGLDPLAVPGLAARRVPLMWAARDRFERVVGQPWRDAGRRTPRRAGDALTAVAAPLLRAPPFPGIAPEVAAVSRAAVGDPASPADDHAELFAAIRAARVGGAFWAPTPPAGRFATVIRPRARADLAVPADAAALWLLPRPGWRRAGMTVAPAAVDPWPLLGRDVTLVAHGDDEWVALARIAGTQVRLLSAGRFGVPGEDDAAADRRIAALLRNATTYRDPFTGRSATIAATIALLASWRRQIDANRGIAVATGFAWWKRREISRFLWAGETPRFVRSTRAALAIAKRRGGAIALWPSRVSPALIAGATQARVGLTRVEDGFIRSVGLGSGLFPPLSVTVDPIGIHYDPATPSALEHLLETAELQPLLARAEALIAVVLAARLGKYGSAADSERPVRDGARRLVLVPGQVENDLSVIHGGGDVAGNLDLLRRVRALEPDAEIWFRPHPDVDAGHRRGAVRDADALRHADKVVRGGAMAPLLETVDALHVLTSLAGFEALLRGREVVTHGTPFYAGWGLTRDLLAPPARRTRTLTLAELVAATLILFPRYLDPVTGLPCPVEVLVGRFAVQARPRRTVLTALRALQGMFTRRLA